MQLAAKSMDGKADCPIPERPSVKRQTKASLRPQCLQLRFLIELAHMPPLWAQRGNGTLKGWVQSDEEGHDRPLLQGLHVFFLCSGWVPDD